MSSKIEQVEEGLFVARALVDPEYAYKFATEHSMIPISYKCLANPDYDDISVISADLTVNDILATRQPVTSDILNWLLRAYPHANRFTINYQPAWAEQVFHTDDTQGFVVVLSAGDYGSFDYSLDATSSEEAQDSYESIEANAGDLIIQLVGGRFHRGRNLGEDPRITAALWQGEV